MSTQKKFRDDSVSMGASCIVNPTHLSLLCMQCPLDSSLVDTRLALSSFELGNSPSPTCFFA